jgi:glutamate carboxypeptidase
MERKMSAALYVRARALSKELGITLGEAFVGGGSDGNFTAALGVPTLDGLGAIGEGAHSASENIVVRAMPERAALLAGLLTTL